MRRYKRLVKVISLAMSLLLIAMLSACNKDTGTSSTGSPPTPGTSSSDKQTVSKDPVTLTAFSMQSVSATFGVEDNWQFKKN